MSDLFSAIWLKLVDPAWYGENIAGLLVFSALVSSILFFLRWLGTLRFKGWVLEVVEHSSPTISKRETPIYWEDAKRMLDNPRELFILVRQKVGAYRWINTIDAKQAREDSKWLKVSSRPWPQKFFRGGAIEIFLPGIPARELKENKWGEHFKPRGWIGDNVDRSGRRILFVSGHPGAHEWAVKQGIDAEMLEHLDEDALQGLDVGDTVIGTLPVNLVAEIRKRNVHYVHLSFDLPHAMRGKQLSAVEMDEYGARLEHFEVHKLGTYPQ